MPWKPTYPIGITPKNEIKQSIKDKIYNHNVTKPVFLIKILVFFHTKKTHFFNIFQYFCWKIENFVEKNHWLE
jgi:hypothetical protein